MTIQARPLQPVAGISATPIPQVVHEKTTDPETFTFPDRGPRDAPIVVICDSPTIEAMKQGLPDSQSGLGWFAQRASTAGFVQNDFLFLSLCAPIPQASQATAGKRWEHVKKFETRLRGIIDELNPRCVVTMGELATRVMSGKAVKITKARGVSFRGHNSHLCFPMMSSKLCRKQPDYTPVFDADLGTLQRLKAGDFDPQTLNVTDVNYRYVTSLTDLILNRPKALSVDTETTGLNFRAPDFKVLTTQLSTSPGDTRIVPTWEYYQRWEHEFNKHGIYMTRRQCSELQRQLKVLLEDTSIAKMAFNLKYDDGALKFGLGINVHGWEDDAELMTRNVCENYLTYSLDDAVRIYVPEMSGYADFFNQQINKSRMIDVPPFSEYSDDGTTISSPGMLEYAGGDPDAVYRLYRALWPMLARDRGQMFLYKHVQMRGLLSFAKRIEDFGQCIDRKALEDYEDEVRTWVTAEEERIFQLIPADVRRKWLSDDKVQKELEKRGSRSIPDVLFGKDQFLIDTLFSKEIGFKLKPQVFTPSTRKLPDDQKVPSTSTKDHLPYFITAKGDAGEFVNSYRDFKKAKTLLSKYIVNFYKYIKPANDDSGEEKIYPSYNFRTNTFRTNSQDPNGQNFPKRGGKKVDFAKGFMKLIKASNGKVIVAADMSQVELRLTAWSAMEPTMLRIYREDGDIHAATAATVMRLSDEEFALLDPKTMKLQRFRAKAVNFGFIYGAMAPTFQIYAKTQYEVDYTIKEAEETRELFFAKYGGLPKWHTDTEEFVRRHGFVKTLHGGTRHLPSVWSTDWSVSSEAVRQAINAPIQRMGSDLGVIAIARLAAQADPRLMRPVGFVHDQLICEVDPGYVEQAMGWLCWVMENPPLEEWFGIKAPLPFRADPEFGMNLAETTEVKRSDIDIVMPEWWNTNEEEAYERFMADEVPAWAQFQQSVLRPDIAPRARVRRV